VMLWRGALQALRREFAAARDAVAHARAVNSQLGQTLAGALDVDYVAGHVEMLEGDFAAAAAIYRASATSLEAHGQLAHLANRASELATALYELGRYDEAAQWIDVAQAHAASHDVTAQFSWRAVAAKIASQQGAFERAENLARRALELVDSTDALNQRAHVRLDYARVLLAEGRADEAGARAAEAAALFDEKENVVDGDRARRLIESIAA
jgi:tetratricopeptide (TPR) repeat protein